MARRLPEPQATEYHRNLVAALRNGMQVGGIVGAARLESILEPQSTLEYPEPWRLPEQYGYVLAAVTPVPFVPCKGLQRFWRPKPETIEALRLRIPLWIWLELQKND